MMTSTARTTVDLIDIPSGALPASCPGCGREVYYVARPSGVRMPVEVGGERTFAPAPPRATTEYDGQGAPHLPRCHMRTHATRSR